MTTEYIERNRTKPFPAIQWTGDNQNEVWLWALAIKKESASVGQTSYAHLGAALLVHVDHCEQSVGKGAWLVWRWDTLFGMSDQSFREQYEPVAGDYYAEAFVGGLSGTNLPTDKEQARQAKRCEDATRSAMAENKARDENAKKRPFDWENSSANIQTIADAIEPGERAATVATTRRYKLGGFVQLSRRGVQHMITGIGWDPINWSWNYMVDNHKLWIPEAAFDLVAAEYDKERQQAI